MIYDTLSRLGTYSCIPFAKELAGFVTGNGLGNAEHGYCPVPGQDIMLVKSTYVPAADSSSRFEAHRHYSDLQIVLSGQEILMTVFPADATRITEYDEKKDVEYFSAGRNYTNLVMSEGLFVYLAPGEIHRPGCPCGNDRSDVVKCVLKIRCR